MRQSTPYAFGALALLVGCNSILGIQSDYHLGGGGVANLGSGGTSPGSGGAVSSGGAPSSGGTTADASTTGGAGATGGHDGGGDAGVGSQSDPGRSCLDILRRGGSIGDGTYWLKPGTGPAFQDYCDMTTLGGGFTLLTSAYAAYLDTSIKQYLYLYGTAWYLSPPTTVPWNWGSGAQLTGTYVTFDGASKSSFDCAGSIEQPQIGVGCSTGGGSMLKTLPMATSDPASGTCQVCQDLPNVFGSSCPLGVKIFVREGMTFELPSSCKPGGAGMTNCGTSGNESCCTTLDVPGGTFYRTYTRTGSDAGVEGGTSGPSGEADPATVSGFRLDKYDVTVGRFRQFAQAVLSSPSPDGGTGWMPTAGSGKHIHLNGGKGLVNAAVEAGTSYEPGWDPADNTLVAPTDANLVVSSYAAGPCVWTSAAAGHENLPMNCVTWQEAFAFCIWDGGFLPSETEWAYAAAGGNEQREFAWGETPPGTANQYAIFDCNYPTPGAGCTGVANIAPVGTPTSGAGKWGQLDLIGNVWQFNMDFCPGCNQPYVNPCTDCTYEVRGSLVRYGFRGGYAASGIQHSYDRNADWPARSFAIGFRCARTP